MPQRAPFVVAALALPALLASVGAGPESPGPGHSGRGPAFDEIPRQRPWKMKGIGATHFSITTSVPEVQEWFDRFHGDAVLAGTLPAQATVAR